ncbi:MAG: hypothetical protein HGA74_06235 [Deltaproteobacteria bacterium]|jgi:uncharacterized membrane protein HdeD (DUF308 family)|nr:hypothetical protein [Deltaproteobacteria bacterium]NTV56866.1 hypothetical protein [Deltaproteobacteria bacterium]
MKNPFLWVLLVFSALVSAYLVFLGVVSISVGLQHTDEEGSWMPVLAGSLCILAVLWILFRVARSLLQTLKKTDSLDVH